MLLVENAKHSSVKLMEGVKIKVTFLYLVRAEITTDRLIITAWQTDQPGKACIKAVGYKPRGVPLQTDCKHLCWGTDLL